jgi:hypothetical protein
MQLIPEGSFFYRSLRILQVRNTNRTCALCGLLSLFIKYLHNNKYSPRLKLQNSKEVIDITVRSLIKFNATINSRLPTGTPNLTAKCYKVFLKRVKHSPIRTIKSSQQFLPVAAE